jgi:hypothetical protein
MQRLRQSKLWLKPKYKSAQVLQSELDASRDKSTVGCQSVGAFRHAELFALASASTSEQAAIITNDHCASVITYEEDLVWERTVQMGWVRSRQIAAATQTLHNHCDQTECRLPPPSKP